MRSRSSWPLRMAMVAALGLAGGGCLGWSRKQAALEVGLAALVAADWAQTRGVVRGCGEENPLIGPCGDSTPIMIYFPLAMVMHLATGTAMPPSWRTVWTAIAAGAELNQVWRNSVRGYGLNGTGPRPRPPDR